MLTRERATDLPEVIELRAPFLDAGAQDTPIFQSDLMWLHLKVYAEGGENDLHCHPKEEHAFIVLEGQATFQNRNDDELVVGRYQGVRLRKGVLYRFHNSGTGNLVMLRIGAGSNNHLPGKADERRGPDGAPLLDNPSQRGRQAPVPKAGEFFGPSNLVGTASLLRRFRGGFRTPCPCQPR